MKMYPSVEVLSGASVSTEIFSLALQIGLPISGIFLRQSVDEFLNLNRIILGWITDKS